MATLRVASARILLAASTALVATLTVFAFRHQPTATLIIELPVEERYAHTVAPDRATSWWRLGLSLPEAEERERDWALIQGQGGDGYELRWQAGSRTWSVLRPGPGPRLLAMGHCQEPPERIEWMRHGDLIKLVLDQRPVLSAIDLLPAAPGQAWSFASTTPPLHAHLDLHDDTYLAPRLPLEPGLTPDAAAAQRILAEEGSSIGSIRSKIEALARSERGADRDLRERAHRVIRAPRLDEDLRLQMAAWVEWAAATAVLRNRAGFDPAALTSSLDLLRVHGTEFDQPPPQLVGIHLDLAATLAEQLRRWPEAPTPLAPLLAERTARARALADLVDRTLIADRDEVLAVDARHRLLLARHLAGLLAGTGAAPTPAEAPGWVASAWRAASGALPLEAPLTQPPSPWRPRPWLAAIDEPLRAALFAQANDTDVVLRARILAAADSAAVVQALADDAVSARSRALATALAALAGHVTPIEALRRLTQGQEGGPSLAETDPLGFALYRLILARNADRLAAGVDLLGQDLPPALTPHRRLLSGSPEAAIVAFAGPGANLSPGAAVAALLAMQEVAGGSPDWNLLRVLPTPDLPLELLTAPE